MNRKVQLWFPSFICIAGLAALCFVAWRSTYVPQAEEYRRLSSQVEQLQKELEKSESEIIWLQSDVNKREQEVKQLKCQLKRRFPTIRDFLGWEDAEECSYEEI
ncbi:hypothetical protein [Fischerella sp. PCC 9605]|uniref:hypothetical protein n=1 Tax=Fischerella sp. PCC 9605 TaxID=1173024 RepID=UPI00047AC774|nr:hypothetical protein [Fischerella sp. PCC 9605]